ncbi:MAG: ATP-binding protein [Gammaproteobacteria bacterium]|nr:ATP-binding protein [Gammaproteobacteria bacterium]HJP04044.1 ATP-binding protein [Gammaproteobacteria bacterium]
MDIDSVRTMADSGTQHDNTWSMQLRALLAGAVIVVAFMLLAGLALDRAFRDSAMEASKERLQARIYMLMGAATLQESGAVSMPLSLPDPALSVPDSGALGAITDAVGTILWRSESSLVATLIYPTTGVLGQPVAGKIMADDGVAIHTLSYPLIWELESGGEYPLIFHAAEDAKLVDTAVATFRNTLQFWLGGAAIFLLLLQAGMLIWTMKPLRKVADEVRRVEAGEHEELSGNYPRELRPLTDNLNAMLGSNRARTDRYRDALADLAHSLKTPLAVLRANASGSLPDDQGRPIQEQLDRMDDTIAYQLQRAAASGRSPLTAPVCVRDAAKRLTDSLAKVYHDKAIDMQTEIPADILFAGDPGDLAEILGNLADNACKWCASKVRIMASNSNGAAGPQQLVMSIEDDGPGIPGNLQDIVTQRGIRADSGAPGQGIGLAIVRDIVVDVYGGQLAVDASELGGARIQVRI